MSEFTRVPSTRNSTRTTAPPESAAVAARFTLVVPAGNAWPLVGAVSETVGAVLPLAADRERHRGRGGAQCRAAVVDGSCRDRMAAGRETRRREGVGSRGVGVHQRCRRHGTRRERLRRPESAAVAARLTLVVPAGKAWPAVGAVTETVGAVFCEPPLLQVVPFSVKDVGGLLVPLNVPLNATLNVALVASVAFHSALLETVTVALPAGCVNVDRPAILDALTIREVEHQAPAVDRGPGIPDVDAGAESVSTHPGRGGVGHLASGSLREGARSSCSSHDQRG